MKQICQTFNVHFSSHVNNQTNKSTYPMIINIMASIMRIIIQRVQTIFPSSSLSLKKFVKIGHIMDEFFKYLKYYIFRLEYSIDDYQNRRIKWTYQTFRRSIWLTLSFWLNIVCISHFVIYPTRIELKVLQNFESEFHLQRSDLVFSHLLFAFTVLEYLWFDLFREILTYKFKVNELIMKYSRFNDDELEPEYRGYLTRFVQIGNLVSNVLNVVIFIVLVEFYLIIIYRLHSFYQNDEISMFVMIIFIILITNSLHRMHYLVGQLFGVMRYLLYFIELLKLRMKRMITQLRQSCCGKSSSINYRLFWPMFTKEYVQLYYEVAIFNQTVSSIFLDIEIISKSAIIFCILFYSKQIQMNVYNTIIVIFFLAPFIYTNGLYSRVAQFPHFNQLGSRIIMQWIGRTQQKQRKNICLLPRNVIKTNLFAQTMSNNQFGISCGQVFFITKYKYTELFLMNFVMTIMFYKKIFM
ncbi:uncharacterized protein LOC124494347 [Dermatophagoides farinae]|uniref:uncharacterized protein LOC124494347 n=1 Tax=Dermatophagoides farinae TaxID=6954 RepID=UPI003F5FDE50